MQLYYAPHTCALACHIALQESGLPYQTVRVSLRDKKTSDGVDFNTINPKGYVPALELDDGEVLTEGPALLAYIGELAPTRALIPAPGTLGNFRVREWLVFIGTELHKTASPLFYPDTPAATREKQIQALKRRLSYISEALAERPFLTGEGFTVADAYLFTVLSWMDELGIKLATWPALERYYERVQSRPAVQVALQAQDSPQ